MNDLASTSLQIAGQAASEIANVLVMANEQFTDPNVGPALVAATKTILLVSEKLPYIGAVAQLLNIAIILCEQSKCNQNAFDILKARLCRFTEIFLGPGGLASIAAERSKDQILSTCTKRLEKALQNATNRHLPTKLCVTFSRRLMRRVA